MRLLMMALPLSCIITLSLFSLMAWMVDRGKQEAQPASEAVRFDMVMLENDSEIQRRQRSVPEQPKPPSMPEPMALSQAEVPKQAMQQMSPIAALGLNTSLDGIAIQAPNLSGMMGTQQAMPLYRVEPRYPSKALKRKIEGYVVMRFTIDASGRPVDIEVIEAQPKRWFEKDAIRALKKWKYQPKVENGHSIKQQGQTVRLEFKLDK